jgi:hypothetical protein
MRLRRPRQRADQFVQLVDDGLHLRLLGGSEAYVGVVPTAFELAALFALIAAFTSAIEGLASINALSALNCARFPLAHSQIMNNFG